MNLYVVLEGERGSKEIYKHWVRYFNPQLRFVERIEDVGENCFYIVHGFGNPFYYGVIEAAISDMKLCNRFDRLVVCVDSEECTRHERLEQIIAFCSGRECPVPISIVIQHFCIETWALGSRDLLYRRSKSPRLKEFRYLFDVRARDPESLPKLADSGLNRAQFAYAYLKAAVAERYEFRNHGARAYWKNEPGPLLEESYFRGIVDRAAETNHIRSFGDFKNAFRHRV